MSFIEKINRGLMSVSAIWAFLLAVIITLDVTGRGLFDAPLTGTLEIIVNSIVVIAFLQIAFAVRSKSMLRADFVVHLLPKPVQKALEVFGHLCGAAIFALLCYAVLEPMADAFTSGEYEGEGALRVPTWPIYAVIAGGAALAAINYLYMLVETLQDRGGEDV
ncbi:TRAP transporter small permease [Roseobacter sp. YSTF-M11]|uniref:TRAP transporter small permease protein n=1 Tax=Roseobacter insulae TaxID=2859783 RepID=A0A9X1FY85_9RHOB|nr:TRAP transporter small permease [Roseobacter insulae]MBW4709818.1 TRAP transporter small permease [Roseobacter insulae]